MSALVLATEAERRARDPLTHAAWGLKLEVAEYLAREQRLRAHPWAQAAMRTWLLTEGGAVLASCESFRMESSASGSAGTTEGIASVFTEEALRGKGHATALMDRLLARFRSEGAQASILYSDVGPGLYARSGYQARPAIDRVFEAEVGAPDNCVDSVFGEGQLAEVLGGAARPDDAFFIWPSAGQLDWHLERERAYATLLGARRPAFCGARAGGSCAFWAADFKGERLVILLLAAARTDEALALLQAARRTASGAGLSKVVLWECGWPFALPGDATGGEVIVRTESIPMICPLDPSVDPGSWRLTARATWI